MTKVVLPDIEVESKHFRQPFIYAVNIVDFDGCLLFKKDNAGFLPSLLVIERVMGRKKLKKTILEKPFIADYFSNKKGSYVKEEAELIDAVIAEGGGLFKELTADYNVTKENLDKIALSILDQKPVRQILSTLPALNPEAYVEIIYRIALIKIGSDCIISSNVHLLNYMKKNLENLQKQFPKTLIICILASGSARQSTYLDVRNYEKFRTGLKSSLFLFFYVYAVKRFLENETTKTVFFPYLFSDTMADLSIGDSLLFRSDFENARKIHDAIRQLISGKQGCKTYLLTQMATMLTLTPINDILPEWVHCTLFDDNRTEREIGGKILENAFIYLFHNRNLLPTGCQVSLVEYQNGNRRFLIYPLLAGEGNPDILRHSCSALLENLKEGKKSLTSFYGDKKEDLPKSRRFNCEEWRSLLSPEEKGKYKESKRLKKYGVYNLTRKMTPFNQTFCTNAQIVFKDASYFSAFLQDAFPGRDCLTPVLKGREARFLSEQKTPERHLKIYSINQQQIIIGAYKILNPEPLKLTAEEQEIDTFFHLLRRFFYVNFSHVELHSQGKIYVYFNNKDEILEFTIREAQLILLAEIKNFLNVYKRYLITYKLMSFFPGYDLYKLKLSRVYDLQKIVAGIQPTNYLNSYQQVNSWFQEVIEEFSGKGVSLISRTFLENLLRVLYLHLRSTHHNILPIYTPDEFVPAPVGLPKVHAL